MNKQPNIHTNRSLWALAAVFVLSLTACNEPAPSPITGPTTIDYTLRWDTGQRVEAQDTGGWAVTNDQGYRVEVHKAFLINYSAELVECLPESTTQTTRWWRWLWPEQVAWAGHGDEEDNPSAVSISTVERFDSLQPVAFGQAKVEPLRYCNAHYLVARSDTGTQGLPTDIDLEGISLHIEGTFAADGAAPSPFTIHTGLATAVLQDIYAQGHMGDAAHTVALDSGQGNTQVDIHRSAETLFDGVDFATADDRTLARSVLRNLHQNIQIHITQTER